MNFNPFKKKNASKNNMDNGSFETLVDENGNESTIENQDDFQNTQSQGAEDEKGKNNLHPYIAELEQNIADWKERHLRLQAEFDNYKKRTFREKEDLEFRTKTDFIKHFLPMIDQIELGLVAAQISDNLDSLKEGVNSMHKNLNITLEKMGIKPMEAKGQTFDSEYHEAIVQMPAPEPELKGKVLDEIKKGYLYNDKVIRYAQVVVGE